MSDLAQRLAGLSPAQRRLLEQRLAKEHAPTAEPIAIVGMACRFPGAANLPAFWRLVHDGINAASEVPPERWSADEFYDPTGETPGKMSVRWAALVEHPDQFDPQFFGITPREAARMDPQQRLLLEVAWEAMENAGRPADQMAGSRTGVFVGIGGTDYSKVAVPYDDYYQHIDAHMGTGNALSIAANRLSYLFDFRGPSAAVDTACSSSSLAVHLAVESLRRRESDAALAGGVNMILTPETTIAFSKARMLSLDGVCRPFDASANGYVRGEGCGLVLLKRLADAERDGDQILAVLRATSVNQDGRTSGISAPNSQSQIDCIRAALRQAGLAPDDISYIEAHGTGTPLGDPIEIQALGEIFRAAEQAGGSFRPEPTATGHRPAAAVGPVFNEQQAADSPAPCYVSSVKANVGHMETVSGVAGLIKTVLMMQHGRIAPQTHFEKLNPHIHLGGTRLVIPTEHVDWTASHQPRRAGVSSFGFGGTNTHLIVESPRDGQPDRSLEAAMTDTLIRPTHIAKLSGKSESAVARQAARLAEHLDEHPDEAIADVCYSANTGRADFNHRAAVVAGDVEQLRERLAALAAGETPAATRRGSVRTLGRPKVAFLFTGQGLQYVGMGGGLYESHPVFRDTLDACDEVLREIWGGTSLIDVLYPSQNGPASASQVADDPHSPLHQTEYTQPALFALEYALAELWRSWGVNPDVLLGHSVGEYTAACVAGSMSLEDSLALIAERARLMQSVSRHGKMAVVFAPAERVAAALQPSAGDVVIAVKNGPENTVISGDAAAVERLAEQFAAEGVPTKMLNVSHAFHSPLMDEMLDPFEQFAAQIEFRPPQAPLVSNLTGRVMREAPSAAYWRDHLRSTVRFAEGMDRIAEANPTVILEIGPTASLLGMGRRCLPQLEAAWLPSLRQGHEDWQVLAASVAEYYVRGGRIDWRGWDKPWRRRRLLLPNYPFERSRHWYTLNPALRRSFAQDGAGGAATSAGMASGHPLLGTRLSTVWTNSLFETALSARSPAFLNDHQVQGSAVTPAAAYLEQGLAAADQLFGTGRHGLENVVIQQAMFLPDDARRRVQVSVAPESAGESTFETYSRPAAEEDAATPAAWTMHATGRLVHEANVAAWGKAPAGQADSTAGTDAPLDRVDLEAARRRAVRVTSRDEFYRLMAERGLAYGPAFQVLDELCRGPESGVARVALPEAVHREMSSYHLHPALGDALLQSMAAAVPLQADGSYSPSTYMPVGVRRVRLVRAIDAAQPLFTVAVRTSSDASPSPERVEGDVFLLNDAGEVLVALEGVAVQRLGGGSGAASVDTSQWLYRVAWHSQPLQQATADPALTAINGAWLIFADRQGIGRQLTDRLAERRQASVLVEAADRFQLQWNDSDNGQPGRHATAQIDPLDERHYRELLDAAFVTKNRPCLGVVHLWSLDIPDPAADGDAWQAAQRLGCGSVLQLIRSLARTPFDQAPSLWLVTSGAQAVEDDQHASAARVAVEQSPLLGLGRVAAMELPDLRPRLVDLDPAGVRQRQANAAERLLDELTAANDARETQIAHRGRARLVARLVHEPSLVEGSAEGSPAALAVPAGQPFQLRITNPGSFDALRFTPVDREPPQPGQVEIQIRATGLNFSDVLKALGLYPGIQDAIVPLGIEASGVVTAVGDGVTRLAVGDDVFGVVPYAFASHARTAEYALVHKPKSIDHDQACTLPITFLTAYHALVRLAHLERGERVLIHAGAGGVGLAAIQIAQHIGAEIFATAGSDDKRDLLRSLGVQHVYSSRSTAFADQILADTGRQGVDVVLNSLPGEAITKSLSILRAYGRFLEIGKTDIYQNRMIGLLPFQDNLSYFAIDLDRMLRQRPETIRGLFAEVMEHFEAGHYQPLMFTRFEAEATIDAFRYMSQRKNIGKVVVGMTVGAGDPPVAGAAGEPPRASVRRDGTYLVTGGLGALGLQVAEWLVNEGAGTVALLSRRAPSEDVEKRLAAIRQKGAQLSTLQGDVVDAQSLAKALSQLPADGPPLRGVVHAAGVLADGVLVDMTLEQLDRAMAPKAAGAWNLHTATRDAPLEMFVLFSSVASVLGSPGQANYAAGNAMLDALAHARRADGLPATAINWGPWAGTGMAADVVARSPDAASVPSEPLPNHADGKPSVDSGAGAADPRPKGKAEPRATAMRGMGLLPPEEALALLGKLVRSGATQATVADARWSDMLRLLGARRPALLANVAAAGEQAGDGQAGGRVDHAFRKRLLEAEEPARKTLVRDYIQQELGRIVGVEPARLDTDQPLSDFGLDSLLALELKNNLEGRLDFTLPMAKLMEGPSIDSLAEETARLVASNGEGASAAGAAEPVVQPWTPLLALRATGTRPPLVLLPALGGDVKCYADLVRHLSADQPVYAFRPRGVDDDLPPHQTMDEMISDYGRALRALQPTGPYFLGGWSTGGIYATALARALEQAGEDVALVALFDTPLPSICDEVALDDDARFLCNLLNYATRFTGTDVRLSYEELSALGAGERFPAVVAEARRRGIMPAETPESFIRRLVHVGEANVRVIQGYQPQPLAATVKLFVPTIKGGLAEVSGRDMPDDVDHGWANEVGQALELIEVPGDHFTMMLGDAAAQIAQKLSSQIAAQRQLEATE